MAFEVLTQLLDMVGSDEFEKNLLDNLPIRKPSIRNPQHGLGIVIGQDYINIHEIELNLIQLLS